MKIKMWTQVKNGKVNIFAKINGVKYEIPKYSPYIPFSVDAECKPLLDRSVIARVYRMRQAMYGRDIGEYSYQVGDQFAKYSKVDCFVGRHTATVTWADPYGWMVEVDIPELGRYYTNYDNMNKTLREYGYKKLG